jgi:secreted trypsin-like serine protease
LAVVERLCVGGVGKRRKGRVMWKKLSVGVVALVFAIAAGTAYAITFGEPDGTRHPNVGGLVTDWNPRSPGPDQFCSGTLVSPTLFLTAAHCLVGTPASQQVWVTFDPVYDEDAASPGGLHAATSWTTHELFGTHGLANLYDLAIVRLASAPAVTPARLPALGLFDTFSQQQLRQLTFTTVGYGLVRTSKKGGPHGFIDTTVRMVAQQTLLSLQPAWLNLNMNPSTGSGGTCFGDSGGPHFLGGMTSNLLVSLTVTGDAMCRATDKTYRLDTEWAQEFLSRFALVPAP